MIGVGKEEQGVGLSFNELIGMEFGTVVCGDRSNGPGLGVDDADDASIKLGGRASAELSDTDEA